MALILGNVALLVVLALCTAHVAEAGLRWTSIVIAGGLVFLFIPALFEVWPKQWRDSCAGLFILASLQLATIAVSLAGGALVSPVAT